MDKTKSKNNNRIKEVRLSQHKTQKEVGKAVGKSDRAIAHYEKGIREPKLETWVKLAKFFGVSVSYLQGLSDSDNTEFKNGKLSQTLNNAVLEIQDILFYMFKHKNSVDVPNDILGDLLITPTELRVLHKIVIDCLIFDMDIKKFRQLIKDISARLIKHFTVSGDLNKQPTSDDILKIINTFSIEMKNNIRDEVVTNEIIINAAIEGIDTGKYILHERLDDSMTLPIVPDANSLKQFREYKLDHLPSQISKPLYDELMDIFNEAEMKINALIESSKKKGLLR